MMMGWKDVLKILENELYEIAISEGVPKDEIWYIPRDVKVKNKPDSWDSYREYMEVIQG